jgi:hypothetical protein
MPENVPGAVGCIVEIGILPLTLEGLAATAVPARRSGLGGVHR